MLAFVADADHIKDLEEFDLVRKPFGNNLGRKQDFMKQSIFN